MARAKGASVEEPEVEVVEEPQTLVGDNEIEALDGDGLFDEIEEAPAAPAAAGAMTTTENFMGVQPAPQIIDEVQEVQTIVLDAPAQKRIVSVTEDIGPVYYGQDLIELKRGVRYRVPEHVYEYLRVRNLVWSVG